MKTKLLFILAFVSLLLWVLVTAVLAQEEPPPPYTGLKNPFPWSDASAQEEGKGLYQISCLGCHGVRGDNLAESNFSTIDYSQSLEERPDFYFWILSEGRLDKGMPPYKSSLSEEQRWQVLTYLWSLGIEVTPPVEPPLAEPPAEGVEGTLVLKVPEQAQSGQLLTLSAVFQDKEWEPIEAAAVKFLIEADFFVSGLMEIGEVMTNKEGIAVLEYTPRQAGDVQVVARHETIETTATLTLAEADGPFYRPTTSPLAPTERGVLIGTESAPEFGEGVAAPTLALQIPAGFGAWLLGYVLIVMLVWILYFRIMYQLFRIPIAGEIRDTDTRIVPLIGMAVMVAFVIVLVTMLITSPYSHFHLLR